jgi:hypothetical protein
MYRKDVQPKKTIKTKEISRGKQSSILVLNLNKMQRKERYDKPYTIYETTYKEVDLRILKNKDHPFYSVYAKRYADR